MSSTPSSSSSSSSSSAAAAAAAAADAAFHEWKQGACRYLCGICDALTSGLAPFVAHLSSAHGVSAWGDGRDDDDDAGGRLRYRLRYGHPRVLTEFVRCRLCARRVVYDHLKLKVHMRRFHGDLDLRTYYDRHVYNKVEVGGDGGWDGPEEEEEEDDDEEEEEEEMMMMAQAPGEEEMEEEEEEEEEVVHPPGKEEEDKEEEMAHPPRKDDDDDAADYDDWVRGCVYECRFCLVRHHRSSDLRDHLIDGHRQEAEADSIEDLICTGTVMQTYTR